MGQCAAPLRALGTLPLSFPTECRTRPDYGWRRNPWVPVRAPCGTARRPMRLFRHGRVSLPDWSAQPPTRAASEPRLAGVRWLWHSERGRRKPVPSVHEWQSCWARGVIALLTEMPPPRIGRLRIAIPPTDTGGRVSASGSPGPGRRPDRLEKDTRAERKELQIEI